jgi:predicted nucleic acid-binding protein
VVNAYFLDSSALVKRYVPEIGSAWVQAISVPATGNLIIIARITWIDLAVLRLQSPITQEAIEKAEKAYEVMSFERGCQTFSGKN